MLREWRDQMQECKNAKMQECILEAVPKRECDVGVEPILAEKIVGLTPDERGRDGRSPVPAASLRVLAFRIQTPSVLADGALERHAAVGVDRVGSAPDDRPRSPSIRRE